MVKLKILHQLLITLVAAFLSFDWVAAAALHVPKDAGLGKRESFLNTTV